MTETAAIYETQAGTLTLQERAEEALAAKSDQNRNARIKLFYFRRDLFISMLISTGICDEEPKSIGWMDFKVEGRLQKIGYIEIDGITICQIEDWDSKRAKYGYCLAMMAECSDCHHLAVAKFEDLTGLAVLLKKFDPGFHYCILNKAI